MAFDDTTRARLRAFVSDARTLLTAECTRQLQQEYGMDPATGEVVELSALPPLDDTRWETARLLRDTLAHYLATSPSAGRTEALQRLVREQAFTVLHRLVALRMMEARGLLLESIARGYQSRGFQLYQRLAGASLGETGDAYRCYLLSLFDEFALDLAVLFDRFSAQGRLFPHESALLELLGLINHPEIEPLWSEDETIGWIYQYYNTQEERRQMRADSSAPRNSRELAVRNQFFTPRYVVEFLTDNTLGRLWYEMTKGQTALTDQCRYLVRRPQEIFLQPGKEPPPQEEPQRELSQEELLQQPVYIPFRSLKDPRDITMLDPACGSMHFGLYAFDLFEVIYDEAWELAHKSDETQKSSTSFESFVSFVVQYTDKTAFLADVPRLIIERNLHGIDIDPRATQIAGLSLWLRAQRTWQQQGLRPQERPRIHRSNIVCAEPMPGEEVFLEEFIEVHLSATPEHKLLGQLVRRVFDAMKLAGEAGSLLKIEEEIAGAVAEAQQKWLADTKPEQGRLFADDIAPPAPKERGLDVTGITDETFWEKAEERIYAALQTYAEQAEHGGGYQRRLFADDTARGFAFIDLCRKRYDVALMNPPFGDPPRSIVEILDGAYSEGKWDLATTFVARASQLSIGGGIVGVISTRIPLFTISFEGWRKQMLMEQGSLSLMADLGGAVLDDAMVETAAYSISVNRPEGTYRQPAIFIPIYSSELGAAALLEKQQWITAYLRSFEVIPGFPLAYWLPAEFLSLFQHYESFEPRSGKVCQGLGTTDDFRFCRLRFEVPVTALGTFATNGLQEPELVWVPYVKGDNFAPYYDDYPLTVNWALDGLEVKEFNRQRYGSASRNVKSEDSYGMPGLVFPRRTRRFVPRFYPQGMIFSVSGQSMLSKGNPLLTLGYASTSVASTLVKAMLGRVDIDPQFEVGVIKRLPFPDLERDEDKIVQNAKVAILAVGEALSCDESAMVFRFPLPHWNGASLRQGLLEVRNYLNTQKQLLGQAHEKIEEIIAKELNLSTGALAYARQRFDLEREGLWASREIEYAQQVLSHCVGTCFGRWDIRFATGERPAPELPDPFAPLPVCPPGQLQNEQGLPITREDVTQLKEEGHWNYPLEIPWDGILVDDTGHPLDLEARVHQVLQVIWKDRWEGIEHEACEILGVRTLRDYFRKPAGFFSDHLKRYSKSRRKAPIYWPLQTPSGSYTLWLYYHRLNDQTLYTCVNDFVEKSKLHEVTEQLNTLRTKTDRSKEEEKKLDHLLDFEQELKDFREELLRVAQCWKPNLNDGVQITAAPLWKLFQHKPWQKTLKETWDKLEKGDYDWAHLAYSIWPDRVRDKCKHDKSLAIAHGLEDLYEAPPEQPKKKRGRTRG